MRRRWPGSRPPGTPRRRRRHPAGGVARAAVVAVSSRAASPRWRGPRPVGAPLRGPAAPVRPSLGGGPPAGRCRMGGGGPHPAAPARAGSRGRRVRAAWQRVRVQPRPRRRRWLPLRRACCLGGRWSAFRPRRGQVAGVRNHRRRVLRGSVAWWRSLASTRACCLGGGGRHVFVATGNALCRLAGAARVWPDLWGRGPFARSGLRKGGQLSAAAGTPSTGRPAARQASNPPITSVTAAAPRSSRRPTARLEE